MSISKSEAFSKAKVARTKVQEINNKMKTIVDNLSDFETILSTINNRITEYVNASDIIDRCNTAIKGNISKKISDAQDVASGIGKIVLSEANKYISALENDYNNSLKEGEDAIHLERASLASSSSKTRPKSSNKTSSRTGSSKSKTGTASGKTSSPKNSTNSASTGTTTSPKNSTNSASSGTTTANNTNNTSSRTTTTTNNGVSVNDQMTRFLEINMSNEVNSADIDSWNGFVEQFLKTNYLNDYISTIRAEDHKIICTLKNGQEYVFSNVSSASNLLENIKTIII
jgi:hypothetical protein